MIRQTFFFLTILLLIFVLNIQSEAITIRQSGTAKTVAFYYPNDKLGLRVSLVGRVLSFSTRDGLNENDLNTSLTPKTKVTVRLSTQENIRAGDELFIINDNNLITGRIQVIRIFQSSNFGYMLVGYGHFKNCLENDRVVQQYGTRNMYTATASSSRGDYYRDIGEYAPAIVEYQKAIKLDSKSPRPHLGLGLIYLKQDMLQFAFREFQEAHKQFNHLHSNEDKFLLLQGMTEVRYKEIFEGNLPNNLRERYRDEGIQFGNEALKIYPNSVRVNYFLGKFYYNHLRIDDVNDRKARDFFLKVVKLEPSHEEANMALAELYLRHHNREKSRYYAEKLLTHDRFNERARRLIAHLDRSGQ